MKRSEVVQELLNSYCFQYGRRANSQVIYKAEKLISNLKKEEGKLIKE